MNGVDRLPYLFGQLKLPTLKAHWQEFAENAKDNGLSYGDFLASLLDMELTVREQNRLARAQEASKLLANKTLSSFSFASSKQISQMQIEQYANDGSWVKKRENLILIGPSGTGKTHLACAIGYQLLQAGTKVLFSNTTLLVQALQKAKAELTLNKMLEKLARFELLILDDIGYVRKSEQETSALFELIESRYETGSLIITANQPFSQWQELFPDPIMAVAAVDRLIHHANIIHIEDESYRAKQARLKNKQKEEVLT